MYLYKNFVFPLIILAASLYTSEKSFDLLRLVLVIC